jgi:hypothetical protein
MITSDLVGESEIRFQYDATGGGSHGRKKVGSLDPLGALP